LQIGPRPEQTETLTQSQIEYELDRIPHQLAQEDQPLLRHRHTILLLALADLHTLRLEYGEPLSTPNYIVPALPAPSAVASDAEYPSLVDTLLLDNLDAQNIAKAKPTTGFIEIAQGKGDDAGQTVARLSTAFGHVVELNQHEVQARLDVFAEMVDLAEQHLIETYKPLFNMQLAVMEDEYCHLQLAATELAVDQHCKALLSEIEDDQMLISLSANKASAHLTKDIVVQRGGSGPVGAPCSHTGRPGVGACRTSTAPAQEAATAALTAAQWVEINAQSAALHQRRLCHQSRSAGADRTLRL
jgi:hypothetical protein